MGLECHPMDRWKRIRLGLSLAVMLVALGFGISAAWVGGLGTAGNAMDPLTLLMWHKNRAHSIAIQRAGPNTTPAKIAAPSTVSPELPPDSLPGSLTGSD